MDPFFPEGYEVPSSNEFMKLEKGENTFRIMSSPVMGYVYWNKDNKPVREREKFTTTPDDIKIDAKSGKPTAIKHFWSMVVWNYNDKAIQQLELTQKGIMDAILALTNNPKWGNPKNYDLTVTREGDGLTTKYTVMPNPQSEVSAEILAEFESKAIDLNVIFEPKDM